jgi:sugar O-acyltransferase (sialic acid O-acetyltransferase NeuD family)
MNKLPLIIIGSSGHAKVVIDIVEKQNIYELIGLIDPYREINDSTFSYRILGSEEVIPNIYKKHNNLKIFIAIGDNYNRYEVKNRLVNNFPNLDFISLIHPSAQLGINVKIGIGVVIMAGVVINSNTIIEDFVIINTRSSIDHDCKICKHTSIAPGVTIGGNCIIGELSAISIGAILKHKISVGNNCLIGAGSLLINDCIDNSVMFGSPAKFIRIRSKNEKYL